MDGKEEQIVSTPGHKYYLPNNIENREIGMKQEHESYITLSEKWVSACKLKSGDKVLLSDGSYGIINSVAVETLESPKTTYNFEVEDFHTYFVSESNVLVHNLCKQKLVAGSEDGWNAKVSVGGETNHKTPHAHVNWKNQKLASVDVDGNILVESKMNKSMQRKMYKFIQKNIKDISAGIKKYY